MTGYIVGLVIELILILGLLAAILIIKFYVFKNHSSVATGSSGDNATYITNNYYITESGETVTTDSDALPGDPTLYGEPGEINPFKNVNILPYLQAYEILEEPFKSYLDQIKTYALTKKDATAKVYKFYLCVFSKKRPILRVRIKQGVPICSFKLENELLRDYRKVEGVSSLIKRKDVETKLENEKAVEIAKNLVDIVCEELNRENEPRKTKLVEAGILENEAEEENK